MTSTDVEQTNDADLNVQGAAQQGHVKTPLTNNEREKRELKPGLVVQGRAGDHHGGEGRSSEN